MLRHIDPGGTGDTAILTDKDISDRLAQQTDSLLPHASAMPCFKPQVVAGTRSWVGHWDMFHIPLLV